MRVIAGSARSLRLETPEGMDTRPTTDRIKETLFNMIQFELPDCRFLDIFSGSGGIGIEALSRGAKEAVFIENNKNALACIEKNLTHTKFAEKSKVMKQDAFVALQSLEVAKNKEPFDVVFMDPPYNMELERKVLEYFTVSSLVTEDTLIIFEVALDTDISYLDELGYDLKKQKIYKTNQHIFVKRSKR